MRQKLERTILRKLLESSTKESKNYHPPTTHVIFSGPLNLSTSF